MGIQNVRIKIEADMIISGDISREEATRQVMASISHIALKKTGQSGALKSKIRTIEFPDNS